MFTIVIAFRFVIGFGLGGVYPLSATKAAEAEGHGRRGPGRASSCLGARRGGFGLVTRVEELRANAAPSHPR